MLAYAFRNLSDAQASVVRLIENFLVFSQLELMASESKKIETLISMPPVPVKPVVSDTARAIATV